jgi:ribosomal protein S18 acetylase RimI-like enzyme
VPGDNRIVHPLDNPIWNSLTTKHAHLALGGGAVRRYPPECAPFIGIADESAKIPGRLVATGEHVGIIGVISPLIWNVVKKIDLCQYVLSPGAQGKPDGDAVLLTEVDAPAMLELTALVYPHYFRAGTPKMGSYFGFFDGERLCAMAGTRFAMPGFQEISAICTHPDYRARGLAGRLTRHLIQKIASEGDTAFLHTESDNPAKAMYEKLGFELRDKLRFIIVQSP